MNGMLLWSWREILVFRLLSSVNESKLQTVSFLKMGCKFTFHLLRCKISKTENFHG